MGATRESSGIGEVASVVVQPASNLLGTRDALTRITARVTRVRIVRAERSHDEALTAELGELFENVKSVDDLITQSSLAARHLEEVGLFEAVLPLIDADTSAPDSYHVVMLGREPKPFKAGLSVSVDNNAESQATFSGDSTSFYGTGERLSVQATRGHKGTALFNVSGTKPLLGWQRYQSAMMTAYRSFNHYRTSCYDALQSGMQLQLSRRRPRLHVDEALTFNSVWRQLKHHEGTAPMEVRSCSAHSLKNSISYSIGFSNENSSLLPSRGTMTRLTTEIAGHGLGGNVNIMSLRGDARLTTPLPYDFICECEIDDKSNTKSIAVCTTLRAAHVINKVARPPLSMIDRLYLGGGTDIRGFRERSAGPSENGCALGGSTLLAGGIHLYKPLFPPTLLFGHAFVTAGSVLPVRNISTWAIFDSYNIRASGGVGIAVKVGEFVRLELNYCWPLCQQIGDNATAGVSLGAGIDFL